MKHKLYDMIVAKAANMELVVFYKEGGEWYPCAKSAQPYLPDFDCAEDYFLCLPKHKKAVIEKLNGGECQFLPPVDEGRKWKDSGNFQFEKWADDWWYMSDTFESRIKPKKEKRWIGVTSEGVVDKHFSDEFELTNYTQNEYVERVARTLTCHQIEVEVI